MCSTYVHEKCFVKLVNVPAHATNCAVCQQKYDMKCDWKKKWSWSGGFQSKFTCVFFILNLITSGFIVWTLMSFNFKTLLMSILFSILIIALAISNICTLIFLKIHYKYTKHICCFSKLEEIIHKTLILPEPIVITIKPLQTKNDDNDDI